MNKQNVAKKYFFVMLNFLLVCSVVYLIIHFPTSKKTYTKGEVVEMSGVLNRFVDKCKVDGECSAYVGNYRIVTNPGDIPNTPELGRTDVWNEDVGKIVKVRALVVSNNELTIVGSKDYYLVKK